MDSQDVSRVPRAPRLPALLREIVAKDSPFSLQQVWNAFNRKLASERTKLRDLTNAMEEARDNAAEKEAQGVELSDEQLEDLAQEQVERYADIQISANIVEGLELDLSMIEDFLFAGTAEELERLIL